MYVLSAQSCPTLCNPRGLQPTRFLWSWKFPCKNTGVGCHFLLQKIFLTQGLKLCLLSLLHWQTNPFPLNHLGSYEWRSKWKFKIEIYRERERWGTWFLVCFFVCFVFQNRRMTVQRGGSKCNLNKFLWSGCTCYLRKKWVFSSLSWIGLLLFQLQVGNGVYII